jgi:hypothetical protein
MTPRWPGLLRLFAFRQDAVGIEVRSYLRPVVRRIRRHWRATQITIRVGGHYGRPEIIEWCDESGIDCIFGLPGDAALACAVEEAAGVWLASDVAMRQVPNRATVAPSSS